MSKTPHTPYSRSRTPSRAGTPLPQASTPSRLIPPVLHSAPSLSSLRVYSHVPPPISVSPPHIQVPALGTGTESSIPSSAASVANIALDSPAEGILVPEPEVEVEVVQGNATGRMDEDGTVGDEDAKKNLREQLRRTLTKKFIQGVDMYPPRQYFVLTDAGKPVFVSPQSGEDSSDFTSLIGLMQALVSVFIDSSDKIRCINAGRTRITFLLRPPLYYVCVSNWGEPESVTRFHLEYLHLQILSVVSAEQLRRMFERRNNFDLRRLLSGAEPLFHSLLDSLEWDLAMGTSSLHCLKLDPHIRRSVGEVLVPTSKIKDVLYVVLIARGRVITLVRPKKHSIHPSDLHILINTVQSSSSVNSSAAASWLPICLPKFNPAAFVNAYVMFLRRKDAESATSETSQEPDVRTTKPATPEAVFRDDAASTSAASSSAAPVEVGLICVSGLGDFDAVRSWCSKLEREGFIKAISNSISQGTTEYSVGDLCIPGLRHFLYKSRSHVQVTMPSYEDPYDDLNEQRRLITLYQTIHDAVHAKSGQEGTLKLQYLRTEKESVMGWVTKPYELYLTMSPLVPKSAVINAANGIARWVQKEEKRLFLRDAPVF
ncbi:trafficking protein Mon1-domain-containing protein [Cytidiella melzeri]|nr:trafficking protein Mon1-domain-containing protein [Cytidiella melzeri]